MKLLAADLAIGAYPFQTHSKKYGRLFPAWDTVGSENCGIK